MTIPIQAKDMTTFKWFMLNIMGHDFMHDFMAGSRAGKKQKLDCLERMNKSIRAAEKLIFKGKKNTNFLKYLIDTKKMGGGFNMKGGFKIGDTVKIKKDCGDEEKAQDLEGIRGIVESVDSGSIHVNYNGEIRKINISALEPYIESSSGVTVVADQKSDMENFENKLEQLNYLNEFVCSDSEWTKEGEDPISHDTMSIILNDYFEIIHENGTIIKYYPKDLENFAKLTITTVLSPIIRDIISIGSTIAMADNQNMSGVTVDEEISEGEGETKSAGSTDSEKSPFFKGINDMLNEDTTPQSDEESSEIKEKNVDRYQNFASIIISETNHSFYRIIHGREIAQKKKEEIPSFIISSEEDKQESFAPTTGTEETDQMTSESIDVSVLSHQLETISTTTEDTVIFGQYKKGSLFDEMKTIIKSNISYNNKGTMEFRIFLEPDTADQAGEILFDYEGVIEESVKMMLISLIQKYKRGVDMEENNEWRGWSDDDVEFSDTIFQGTDKLIDIIHNMDTSIKIKYGSNKFFDYNALIDRINRGDKPNNIKREIFLIAHPDKIVDENAEIKHHIGSLFSIFKEQYELITFPSRGGMVVQSGGGGKETKRLSAIFRAGNTLLAKAILENSLTVLECVKGDKHLGYFPQINSQKISQTHFFKNYGGLKPILFDIFEYIPTTEIKITGSGDVDYDSFSPEIKNKLARRILLNVQIFIIYAKCVPGNITVDNILNALYLKLDKAKSHTYSKIAERGYWGVQSNPTAQKRVDLFYKTDLATITDKIKKRRQKFFGFLFDSASLIEKPTWIGSNEDDMLQDSFNIVLQKLLIGNIFMMSKSIELPEVSASAVFPSTQEIGTTTGKNAYVINNAVPFIYPQKKNMGDPRFGFMNLDGSQSREVQFCPVTSIADAQPQCSIGASTQAETESRSLNYSMDMGLEVKTTDNSVWSYYVNMEKINDDRKNYEFFISGTLSLPTNSFTVGDRINKKDLLDANAPLGAVTTFYEILSHINTITKNAYKRTALQRGEKTKPRTLLRNFFTDIMEDLLKFSIKKSIGDYGQEFTAVSKYGTLENAAAYEEKNKDESGMAISIPYNSEGNSLRIFAANDRPSAYRGAAFLLFTQPNSINTRAVMGYYRENYNSAKKIKDERDAITTMAKTARVTKETLWKDVPKNITSAAVAAGLTKKGIPKKNQSSILFKGYTLPKNTLINSINIYSDDKKSILNYNHQIGDAVVASTAPVEDKHYNRDKSLLQRRTSVRLQNKEKEQNKWSRRMGSNRRFAKWVKQIGKELISSKTPKGKKHNKTLFNEWRTTILGLSPLRGGRIKKKLTRKKRNKKKMIKKNRKTKKTKKTKISKKTRKTRRKRKSRRKRKTRRKR